MSGAPAYEKSQGPTSPSKVVVFQKYLDDTSPSYVLADLPLLGPVGAQHGDEKNVQLVACVDLKRQGSPSFCNFHGGKLELYDMTYSVRVLEAKTGNELSKEEFSLDRRTHRCPGVYRFAPGANSAYRGADYTLKLLGLLLPLQPPGIELPKVASAEIDAVCSGSVVPQMPAYDRSKSGPRGLRTVYFGGVEQTFTTSNLPDGFPPNASEAEGVDSVELVACVTAIPRKKIRECEFTGGGVLETHDGEFEVEVYEAATRKLVEKKSFKGSSPRGCPVLHKFWGQRDKRMTRIEPAFRQYLEKLRGP